MPSELKIAHQDILIWVLLFGGIGALWGVRIESASRDGMGDFRAVYSASRCLFHRRDPYKPGDLRNEYLAEGGKIPTKPSDLRALNEGMLRCINLPSALFLVAPLAVLPWGLAHLIWMLLILSFFLLATYLIFRESAQYAAGPPLILIGIFLVDLGLLLSSGNSAGITIGLCVLAGWLLLNQKYHRVAVTCLTVALLLKPHDAAFVWLYFLVAPSPSRKYAVQMLVPVALFAVLSLVWVYSNAPGWAPELSANLHTISAKGGWNDPGSASPVLALAAPINLQGALSVYRDDPRFYDPFAYTVSGGLLFLLLARVANAAFTQKSAWIALASLAALTMLPVYHRRYDAGLLLLAVPACALLWDESRWKWAALVLSTVAIAVTGILPFGFLELALEKTARLSLTPLAPLALLAMGIFYLWVYWRQTAVSPRNTEHVVPSRRSISCSRR